MSKILFISTALQGSVNPTLAIVRELIENGHEVWYYSYDEFKEQIENIGAIFVSCDKYDCNKDISHAELAKIATDRVLSTKLLVDSVLAFAPQFMDEIAKIDPDCIVADYNAFWGKAVAAKLKIPFICSVTSIAVNGRISRDIKKRQKYELKQRDMLGPSNFTKLNTQRKLFLQAMRLRKEGLRVKNITRLVKHKRGTHSIIFAAPEFYPRAKSFSRRCLFVFPQLRKPYEDTRKRLDVLLYASIGNIHNRMPQIYVNCVSAFSYSHCQVIISVGDHVPPDQFANAPINIAVRDSVDQISVLEKSDMVITHCGLNTVGEALYYGLPLIMIPQTDEEKVFSLNLAKLDVGIMIEKATDVAINKAYKIISDDGHYRETAKKFSDSIKNAQNLSLAVEKILSVAGKKKKK